jgi:rhodanese-related sulfurtransferase
VPDDADRRTLDDLLADAAARITRHAPADAYAALQDGVVLIDVRSGENRERDGIVPGSLHIPRTVLEWRLDPGSPWCNPHVGGIEQPLILLCDHGYSTVLAAANLAEIGFSRAGDVVGGFAAWRDAGLPTAPAPVRRLAPGERAGMTGPD